ncbi:MAG: molecular chaperone [Steroidobacteraceae bacterium]
MIAGIDFGTSSSSLGIWQDGRPTLVPLDGDNVRLASVLHTARTGPRGREVLTLEQAIAAGHTTVFGEAAMMSQIEDPLLGFFVKSPKTFLGAELKRSQLKLFTDIVTRMLAHIRAQAESRLGSPLDRVVLGRPVNFHGTRGESGNSQATAMLQAAAQAAGFREVEFLLEPIAAALDYERTIARDQVVLVLDAGGGTTDCSMVRVGPSFRDQAVRDASVLGNSGTRVGGIDIDIKLALRKIMPLLGLDSLLLSGLPVPNSVYWKAAAINDVTAQAEFYARSTAVEIDRLQHDAVDKHKLARLHALHEGRLTYRVNRSAELAKIGLSDQDSVALDLAYLASGLATQVSVPEMAAAIERELAVFVGLMREVELQAQTRPDVIYVTGGTARSPIVERYIREHYGDMEIVVGDLFGSVTSGLTTWAQRLR